MASQVNQNEDFLEVDKPIPGQNFACLSFVSPEKLLQKKELFIAKHFLKKHLGKEIDNTEFDNEFDEFIEENESAIDKKFAEEQDYQTSIRGVKVRGVYDSYKEAEVRAKVLQKLDSSFHVYVGQVGYWLPWDPNPNNVENQEYMENELNMLMKEYKKNEQQRDIFYAEQTKSRKNAVREENEQRKKEAAESVESESGTGVTASELFESASENVPTSK